MGRRASAKVYEISNFSNKIKAKNANQELYLTYLNDFSKNYVFATGPAGTGKTLLAVEK
jgi:phosphate starvation-inducible protein PhoH